MSGGVVRGWVGKVLTIAALGAEVGKRYAEITSQEKTLAKLRGDLAKEEKALDGKLSAGDKATHEKQRDALKKEIDKTEDAYDPKVEALKKAVKANASKA